MGITSSRHLTFFQVSKGVLAAAFFGTVTCTEIAEPPASGLGPTAFSRTGNTRGLVSSDDRKAALAGEIPGFGGLYWSEDGVLNVLLKDPSKINDARARLGPFLSRNSRRSARMLEFHERALAAMRARPAQFDFRELLSAYRLQVIPAVSRLSGVTMTDIDERSNRIVVGVVDERGLAPLQNAIGRLRIPAGIVEVSRRIDGSCDPGSYYRPQYALRLSATPNLIPQQRSSEHVVPQS